MGPFRAAYAEGKLSKERLSDMVRRILRSMYAVGIDAPPRKPAPEVDMAKHHEIALETARQGIVLLKNDGILPLAPVHDQDSGKRADERAPTAESNGTDLLDWAG